MFKTYQMGAIVMIFFLDAVLPACFEVANALLNCSFWVTNPLISPCKLAANFSCSLASI